MRSVLAQVNWLNPFFEMGKNAALVRNANRVTTHLANQSLLFAFEIGDPIVRGRLGFFRDHLQGGFNGSALCGGIVLASFERND